MKKYISYIGAAAVALPLLSAGFATAQEPLKIGYIGTLSGPVGASGEEMLAAFKMALEESDNTLGGRKVELVIGDDQAKPQTGVQLARDMMQRDGIEIFTGMVQGPVTEAVTSLVTPRDNFVVVPVGASSTMAGKGCNANLFVGGWSTDTNYEAIGQSLKGSNKVAAIATNYQAGWDAVAGFKRTYGDDLLGEFLITFGQSDYSTEISQLRASGATSLVMFLPGGDGIAFLRQFQQAGLGQTIQLYSAGFQADEAFFRAVGDGAMGMRTAGNWYAALDNPVNQAFVAAYREKHGKTPSTVAALAYDSARILDAALRTVAGDISDKQALRAALRNVSFESVRGKVTFGNNHFPVQDFYLASVAKSDSGQLHSVVSERLLEARADAHAGECQMAE